MTISIRRAVEADIPAMGTLDVAGYRGSAFRHAMFPPSERVKPGDEDALEWFAMGARQCLESTSMLYMVAVEAVDGADETVVGMAIWTPPRVATPATKKDTDGDRGDQADIAKQEKQESKPAGRPPGLPSYLGYEAVMEAQEETQKMLDSQTILPEKERNGMWYLVAVTVDEHHRRKGIGKALVQWGIDQATQDNKSVWLVATGDGKQLYTSMGFTLVQSGTRCSEEQHIMFRPIS